MASPIRPTDWCKPALHETTQILVRLKNGEPDAAQELWPRVYEELLRCAESLMRGERPGHTLDAPALVNEVYLKLVDHQQVDWQHRVHFVAGTVKIMRHILVDHARARNTARRGGGRGQIRDAHVLEQSPSDEVDYSELDEALQKLSEEYPRQARVVELHHFGDLTYEEIGYLLDIARDTVKKDWKFARSWLHRWMTKRR